MANTTYATLAEFQARVNDTSVASSFMQQMLNAAASVIDNALGAQQGAEFFSATSAGVTRYFDDRLDHKGIAQIDEALAVTAVVRGTGTVTSTYYKLYPYNPGNGPYTGILFRSDGQLGIEVYTGGSWYGYPYRYAGAGQLAITGTWGYCTEANRPDDVKEATLIQAVRMYERQNLKTSDIVQMMSNPYKGLDPLVEEMIAPYRRCAIIG